MDIVTMIVDGIKNLFFGEQPGSEKAANLAVIIVCIFLAILALESAMGLITIGRLEREVNILKQLSELSEAGVGNNENAKKLNDVFEDAVNSLETYEPVDVYAPILQFVEDNKETMGDILPGAAAWIFLAILIPFMQKDAIWLTATVTVVVLLFGLAVGWLASLIVNTGDANWTVLIRFVIGLISLVLIGGLFNRSSSRAGSENSSNEAEITDEVLDTKDATDA